jgi:hypothetical protein
MFQVSLRTPKKKSHHALLSYVVSTSVYNYSLRHGACPDVPLELRCPEYVLFLSFIRQHDNVDVMTIKVYFFSLA